MVTQTSDTPDIGELRRYDLRRHREERARASISPHTVAFAQDGDTGCYLVPLADQKCTLGPSCPAPFLLNRSVGVRFEPAPPLQLR